MTLLAPIMLLGWVPLTIWLFLHLQPHRAVLVSVIGGWLFLPHVVFNLQGLPEYSKATAIALGLIIGGRMSGHRQTATVEWTILDLPMLVWCIFTPLVTSLNNHLGLYDGLSGMVNHFLVWGVPYMAGRIYFDTPEKFNDLYLAIIIGGLVYMPLCLFEVRMSPKLSKIFYGFFPHSFAQHIREGGYRPIVFMQHGLMVSLWMALSAISSFWYWRSNKIKDFNGIPLFLIFAALAVTTILCKSSGATAIFFAGCASYLLFRFVGTPRIFVFLVMLIPCYIIARSTNYIPTDDVLSFFSNFFDERRIRSLAARLLQEDLISVSTLERAWFGWGGWGRGMPVNVDTGKWLIGIRDALWLISFNSYGYVGVFSLFFSLLIGPFMLLNSEKLKEVPDLFQSQAIVLCLVVTFFSIDSLVNGMVSPFYITISGSVISLYLLLNKDDVSFPATEIAENY